MIRLVALDLDGTLFNDQKQVPASAAEALRDAARRGATIALCSGRNHADILYAADAIGIPVWSISANGAYLGHSAAGVLWAQPLSAEKAARVILLSYRFHAAPCVYTPLAEYNDIGYARLTEENARKGQPQLKNPAKKESVISDPSAWQGILARESGNLMKCIVFLQDPAQFPAFRDALAAEGGLTVDTSVMFGGLVTSVEINREGVSKGKTLTYLQEHLGIGPECTLCFGDSGNDLSMLPNGRFIAMGNARDEIKARAWAVTGSNNADGIAQALAQYLDSGTPSADG